MNVLLVEPDKIMGQTTKSGLEKAGLKVSWKRDAQGALDAMDEMLAGRKPDVVVLEIQLGLHNGIEFLYEIASYPEWQNVPVIVHSINANILDSKFSNSLAKLGVGVVLYKPKTSTAQLVKAVNELAPVL